MRAGYKTRYAMPYNHKRNHKRVRVILKRSLRQEIKIAISQPGIL